MKIPIALSLASLAIAHVIPGSSSGDPSSYSNVSNIDLGTRGVIVSRGDDDETDFNDYVIGSITRLAAIGDSYSAGIGAGDRLGSVSGFFDDTSDYSCSRYSQAYPSLVNKDFRIGDSNTRSFQFLSCSGAIIKDVLDKQIPRLNGNQQAILLSAGGNDAELTDILNQCIYQWGVMTSYQANLKKIAELQGQYEWAKNWDFERMARGCDGQLGFTQDIVNSDGFSSKIDQVIAAAKTKLASDGMIYYTGYAKFWAEDMTADCDKVTWTSWIWKAYTNFPDAQRLTREHRSKMNSLVDTVNSKIAAAVQRAGSNVVFVDYDSYVGKYHGRFCEAGVDEARTTSNSRDGLMFYEMNGLDPLGTDPWKRSEQSTANGTHVANLNVLAQITLELDPDAKLSGSGAASQGSTDKSARIPNILPDGYGRVFHPQVLLHRIIANKIIWHMGNEFAQRSQGQLNKSPESFHFDSCPIEKGQQPTNNNAQQVAIASYINPYADPGAWNRIISYDSNKVSVVIANVLNGPDSQVHNGWKGVIDRAAASGKTVIAYVRTGYLGVSQQKFATRLGSTDLADWVAQIEQDVEKWYEIYDNSIGGIFFDEDWNDCGPNNIYADLYAFINRQTKRRHPGAFTVLNPGAPMPKCFENSMDALMTFESSYETYINSYVPNDWLPAENRKIWHIVYNVPQDQIGRVAQLAKDRRVGLLEITDDVLPNPYDNLPNDAYMHSVFDSLLGGKPKVAQADSYGDGGFTAAPSNLQAEFTDYTSVRLAWAGVDNARGYRVYLDRSVVAEVPSYMYKATIGMLNPNTTGYRFYVRSIGGGGSESGGSNDVMVNTLELPNGLPAAHLRISSTSDKRIIEADLYTPYAFERFYICFPDGQTGSPSWGIRWGAKLTRWCHYMLEGVNSYQKTGNDGDWSWQFKGTSEPDIHGYTRRWSIPENIAASLEFKGSPGGLFSPPTPDSGPTTYVMQFEGYGPLWNAFAPCPESKFWPGEEGGKYCMTPP